MSKKHITTIEELASSTQEEFLAIRTEQQKTNSTLVTMVDTLDLMRADIHDIKLTLGPLARHATAMEEEVFNLKKRLDRVEKKVGIAR